MINRLCLLVGVLVFLLPQVSFSAQKITEYMLINGLQLVVIEDHRTPAVLQMLWYRVGGSDGPPGKSGLAHYVEHLMFKGTERFGPKVYTRTVENLGGYDNAFTSYDYTAYIQRIAADHLETIMELEADRMTGLLLSEEDIETERSVVLEERSLRTDTNPSALLNEQMNAALYLNHPYSLPVIGWRHEIEQLSREDIFDFYHHHYAPNNAVLIIAGDVDPAEVFRLANKHYGKIPRKSDIFPRSRPADPPHIASRRLVFKDERVANPYLLRNYLATERNPGSQRKAASLVLLAALLANDGVNSYLKRKLETEQKIALYTDAYYSSTTLDKRSFGVIVMPTDPTKMQEAEVALDEAIEEFLKDGVDAGQLDRIKKAVHAEWIYEQDSVQSVAQRIGQELIVGLTLKDIAEWPDILQSITPTEILDTATELFQLKNSVTGWVVKEEAQS